MKWFSELSPTVKSLVVFGILAAGLVIYWWANGGNAPF